MRLELNTNGAWRLLLAGLCGKQIDRARDAAATLAALDTGKRPHVWRLVDYDGSVVAHCDGPSGWLPSERQRRGAELAADLRDAISFPPLPPSPAEVGDLILQTREHVQALGWGNREQLYTASQVRALLSECAITAAARERERTMFSRRPGLWALRAREVLELIAAPMRPDGTWNRDREACRQMAAEALGRYED